MTLSKYGKLEENPAKLHETVTVQMKPAGTSARQTTESTAMDSKYLLPRIEAIHAGRTRNFNYYPADKLKGDAQLGSGVYSWLDPYPKPVIYNHDTDTDATGRILSAAYADYTQAGRPGIILIPKITEPSAVQALKDGRLLTVSIGATSDAAICSICGTDIVNEGFCGHMKGEEYNGQVCEWIAGNIWFDELSWVNVPADSDAMVVDTQSSVFLDTPQESAVAGGDNLTESAPSTPNEQFGVPKHTKLVVIESKEIKRKKAENKEQEENKRMDKEPKTVVETPEVPEEPVNEPETPEKVVEPETEPKEPETDNEPNPSSGGDTPEEPAAEPEEDDKEEPEDKPEETDDDLEESVVTTDLSTMPSIEEVEALKNTATTLQAQVDALTSELKTLYVERIVEKSTVAEDKKELFVERLSKRSIDSLKDRLEDMQEGFNLNAETPAEPKKRIVQKVDSPVPTTESADKKEVTSDSKVSFLASLLG